MCGIAGMFDIRGLREVPLDVIHRMNESQHHRGPDGGGVHVEAGVGLAHRRLSIIDLAGGHQPMHNEDGNVTVVYNGEIYNYRELISELQACGHVFRTHCDTEVIVHGWEEWGPDCVTRFRGMFAFALWDRRARTLFLGRDRLGVKPLYYALLNDGWFLFGSELKALRAHPWMDREIDVLAVEDYFAYGYVPEPRTIYRSAKKLPPACTLKVVRGSQPRAPRQYWDVPFAARGNIGEEEGAEELVRRLREAVSLRLVSEVPLGAFLSGGVDSSAVVAMMASASNAPVNTCSISFGDPRFDEAQYARKVAERYGTRHRVETVESDDFHLIDRLARLYDEPFADSSAVPTYRVCQLARKSVTVALSGDGGDESFGGYRRYRYHVLEERMREMMPLGLRQPLFGLMGRIYPKADWAPRIFRAKTTFEALAMSSATAYFNTVAIFRDPMRERLFSHGFKRKLNGYRAVEVMLHHASRAPTEDPLGLVQYLDMHTYLVGDINTKVDRSSMAHSLEVREPLMDHELVEWVSALPSGLKVRGRTGKYLLKKAMEPFLPRDVIYRPKMGFSIPVADWLRGPLRPKLLEAVRGEVLADTEMFDRRYLNELVERHLSGARDYSAPLWSLLMFDAFLRNVEACESAPVHIPPPVAAVA
jgi:asparagine synthase (glutamine-hydrolysing)